MAYTVLAMDLYAALENLKLSEKSAKQGEEIAIRFVQRATKAIEKIANENSLPISGAIILLGNYENLEDLGIWKLRHWPEEKFSTYQGTPECLTDNERELLYTIKALANRVEVWGKLCQDAKSMGASEVSSVLWEVFNVWYITSHDIYRAWIHTDDEADEIVKDNMSLFTDEDDLECDVYEKTLDGLEADGSLRQVYPDCGPSVWISIDPY